MANLGSLKRKQMKATSGTVRKKMGNSHRTPVIFLPFSTLFLTSFTTHHSLSQMRQTEALGKKSPLIY